MTGLRIQLRGGRPPDVRVDLATLDVAEELRIATLQNESVEKSVSASVVRCRGTLSLSPYTKLPEMGSSNNEYYRSTSGRWSS